MHKFSNHKLIELAIQIRHVRLRLFLQNCLKLLFKDRKQDLLMLLSGREQQFEIQFESHLRTNLECLCLFRNSTAPRNQCMLKLDDQFQASLQFLFIAQKTWNNLQVQQTIVWNPSAGQSPVLKRIKSCLLKAECHKT